VNCDWASARARLSPERTAIVDLDHDRGYSFADMLGRTARLGGLVEALGARRGERVAILAKNCMAHVDLFLLAGYRAVTLVPLNWRLPLEELRPLVAAARVRLLLFAPEFAQAAQSLAAEAGIPSSALGQGCAEYEARLATSPELPPQPAAAQDVAMLLFTGGTTGIAKGVRITHRQVFWNAVNTVTSWELSAADCAPVFTPFYHTGGYHVLLTPLYHAGGQSLVAEAYTPALARQAVREHGVSVLFMVPTMFQSLIEAGLEAEDMRTVRFAISGGAACPPWVEERFAALGVLFKQGYGLTEVGPNCFSLALDQAATHPGSVGVAVFHLEVRITGADGSPVPPGEPGELWLRGPTVADGYEGRPEETAAVFDADGFCHTGDLAQQDEAGFVRIVGRKKEMFISGGENVYPIEVENALYAHPAVALAAVLGVPHPHWGEAGIAWVQLRPGEEASSDDLLTFLAARLARYKLPKELRVVVDMPLTAAGKVAKEELRRQYAERLIARDR
jgi:fatty-acyl-CoA synthase